MADILCKDYVIFKIKYQKKKYDFSQDIYVKYLDFIHDVVELLTKKNKDYWYQTYGFGHSSTVLECMIDELQEDFGILFMRGEGEATMMVPKNMNDLILYVRTKCPVKWRIVTRTNMFYHNIWGKNRDLKHNRNVMKVGTDEVKAKFNI